MLVSLHSVLKKAQRNKYAIGAFNTSNLEATQAIIDAAQKLKSPVIVSTSEKAIDYAGLSALASMIKIFARMARVPVVLHLDHAKTFELVKKCIAAGYTSVMLDGSRLPFKKNIALTKKVSAVAHKFNISVEGELGTIGGKEDYISGKNIILADPKKAKVFVDNTKVDALAAAVGTAHGLPIPKENIDFKRLRAIQKLVSVPLVLHGASQGIFDKDIKKAIKHGICKVNIDTDLRLAFTNALRKKLQRDKKVYDPRAILSEGRSAVMKKAMEKMRLFGSVNKA